MDIYLLLRGTVQWSRTPGEVPDKVVDFQAPIMVGELTGGLVETFQLPTFMIITSRMVLTFVSSFFMIQRQTDTTSDRLIRIVT